MRKRLLCFFATMVAILVCAGTVHAQLVYSFEGGLQGFAANGAGTTVTSDTIGATQGTNSMKTSVVAGATFVGALTSTVPPAIGDPPGVNHILFDMTIAPGQAFTGGFAVVGVTVFGASQPGPGQMFGLPVQFADTENIGGKAPGTYPNVRIDLNSATHPTTFQAGRTFNQIFGPNPGAPNDIIPTGFQFFFNKSNDQALNVYIDNVRVVTIPEPATWMLLGLSAAICGAFCQRRR
jgi:PEP-CTERM motif